MVEVILPVLDEAAALPWVLDRLPGGFHPLVVDNGSSDGSAEIARRLGARVSGEPRRGFCAACWAGLAAVRAAVACFRDCDGSLDPCGSRGSACSNLASRIAASAGRWRWCCARPPRAGPWWSGRCRTCAVAGDRRSQAPCAERRARCGTWPRCWHDRRADRDREGACARAVED